MHEIVIDPGDNVACDICNEDYTESDESGGLLSGSYAICPKCAMKQRWTMVKARCPEGKSFANWVREDLR